MEKHCFQFEIPPVHPDCPECKDGGDINLRDYIKRVKANKFCPALSDITVTNVQTGERFTLDQIDQIFNN